MIHRIFSSLGTFKTVEFKPGLNILVTEKTAGASSKQTRNSAGKSSLLEIIHFLTGGSVEKSSIFLHPQLSLHSFGMEFDLGQERVIVQRSGDTYSKVAVQRISGQSQHWTTDLFGNVDGTSITNSEWVDYLGNTMFNLGSVQNGEGFRPKFRALFSYFVRRESAKAFLEPSRQSQFQKPWDQQVMLSYLLGLDWTIAREWQVVRDREKSLRELRNAAGTEFAEVIGSAALLRVELAEVEQTATHIRQSLAEFRILPTYREQEKEAEEITRELRDLRNDNQVDRALIADLSNALNEEAEPEITDLDRLYREATIVLPEVALRRFEEVRLFHASVIANRRRYLEGELEEARQRASGREMRMAQLDRRRAETFSILTSHRALDELTAAQVELARLEAQATMLRNRYKAAQQLESTSTELDIERRKLQLRLQQDYDERSEILGNAGVVLRNVVEQLYGTRPGRLLIDPTANGPRFTVKIEGDRGKGISNMEILPTLQVPGGLTTIKREPVDHAD